MNNNSNNCGDCGTTCSECGRPWAICKQDGGCGCNKCKDIKFCEYGRMANGCIREKQPGCPMQAVIPSVTVESIEGIKNLADCFVHVTSINTTFYIDDKHRPIITWAGPIDIPGYDMEGNPNNYRDQIVTDVANQMAVIYDKSGKGYLFGLAENLDVQEEIDNKLDEMAKDGTLGEIVADYAATKVDYFHITASSTMQDILDAFSGNQTKVIDFDKGTYLITSRIFLGSNTVVNLNGAMLKKSTVDIMFGYPLDTVATGFDGVHDVTFNSGTINLSMALMHNANFEFNNITFGPDLNTHAIQIAASKNISFNGCVFKGRTIDSSVNISQQELLQLETATSGSQPWLIDPDSVSYDHKGNENILINGCVFESGDGENYGTYTCIGHHASDAETPYAVENLAIKNCKFGNTIYSPLTPAGWSHYEISGCEFSYSGSDSNMYLIRHRWFNRYGVIKNNIFNGGQIAITNVNVVGMCEHLLVEGNDVSMTSNDSHIMDLVAWNDVVIRNNNFKSAKSNYINAYADSGYSPSNVIIEGNTFNSDLSTSKDIIYLANGNNFTVINNTSYQQGNQYFISISSRYDDGLRYDRNTILSSNPAVRQIYVPSDRLIPTPEFVYNLPFVLYSGGKSYSAITNQGPRYPFESFNAASLLLHKTNNPLIKTDYQINAWTFGKRLSEPRIFYVSLPDSDGTMMTGVFEIKADGTFSYTSPTNNLSLRSIRAYNTNLYNNS